MNTTQRRTSARLAAAALAVLCGTPALAQVNLLSNPGFEIGYNGQGMYQNINSWPALTYPTWNWGRIRSAAGAGTATYAGTNMFQLDAFANYNKVMAQTRPVSAGIVYEVEGWMKSPAGSAYFQPTNGFCYVKVEYFNSAGTQLGFFGEDSIVKFGQSGPTNWTRYTTGPVLAPANAVTSRVLFGYCPGGDDWAVPGEQTVQGYVYVDDMRLFTNTDHQSGVLSNYSFEVRTCDYLPLTNMPYWEGFGTDGGVVTNHHRTGQLSLQIWGVDSLGGQRWPATRSNKYATSAYIFSTNFTSTNAYALVVLQFLDSTGTNVLQEYQSPHFDSTSPSNTWTNFTAVGVAPSGTVYGRTMCGVVGDPTGFGTSGAWFDDATQQVTAATSTVSGLLSNPGFDDGPAGNAYDRDAAGDFPHWAWLGGTNAGFVTQSYRRDGEQSLAVTYPDNAAAQEFAATTGMSYVVDGYLYTPASGRMTGTAYGVIVLEFYRGTNLASTVETLHFTSDSPSNTWVKFSVTNRAPWSGAVTGRVMCGIFGDPSGFGGTVYFDSLTVTETNIAAVANVQAGALWNPGLEYTARGTLLSQLDDWLSGENLGASGDAYKKSGNVALSLTSIGAAVWQGWEATQGWKYATAGYAYTPAADRLAGASDVHAVIQLQYLDAASNVLQTYDSPWFTTNIAAGTWTNLEAVGTAPAGTKYGRTMITLAGTVAGFDGSVWFDDMTQRVASTTGTVAGLILNPGFEDGPPGNAYDLEATNDLPAWTWLGGTNAGFITTSYKYEGGQSLAITWPSNMMAQSFPVASGRTCVAEGYLYTPASERMTGTAYGVIILEFYRDGEFVSSVETAHFTSSSPSNTWVKLAVTNRAPWGAGVTGRVICAIMGSSAGYGGALYFDGMSVTDSYVGATNIQAGEIWNPGFEYTSPGTVLEQVDSWTALGNAGLVSDAYAKSGKNSLRIYGPETLAAQTWSATAGWKYGSSAFAYTPVADRLAGASDLHALVMLQFFDSTGTNLLISYESPWFTTNTPAGAWSNLEVIGVAPVGSIYGRTVVGLLGSSDGFGGSVYFDDATQRVVATSGTTSGLLHNPGFDDGPSGNAATLYATNDLPYWKWIGGTNAGFIARDYKKDYEQALTITYPENYAVQDWTAASARYYKAEGWLFTPAGAEFDTDGTCFGRLEMTFYVEGGTEPYTSASAFSAPFGASQPSNQWIYFAVTGRAPEFAVVTGRLACAIAATADPTNDLSLAGVIYFDQLTLNQIDVTWTADVAVACADAPDPVTVGEELTYTISVTNQGPDEAENVVVTDVLPGTVNFVSCSVSQGTYDQFEDTVTCRLGTMGNGATACVTIVVTPTLAGRITNDVSATADGPDNVSGNNRASAETDVHSGNRAPEIVLPGPHTLVVGCSTTFAVTVSDPDHDPGLGISNTVAPAGATYVNSNFSWTAGAAFAGTTNLIVFVADDGTGETNSVVTNSTTITVPYDSDADSLGDGWEWLNFSTLTNPGTGDNDSDLFDNAEEQIAGTQPTNASSYFRLIGVTTPTGTSNHQVKVATEPGRKYTIYFTSGPLSNASPWSAFATTNTGVWIETAPSSTNHVFTDDEGADTTGSSPSRGARYYKTKVSLP